MHIIVFRVVIMFVNMLMAWWYWKKKDIGGVILYCTLTIISAMAF